MSTIMASKEIVVNMRLEENGTARYLKEDNDGNVIPQELFAAFNNREFTTHRAFRGTKDEVWKVTFVIQDGVSLYSIVSHEVVNVNNATSGVKFEDTWFTVNGEPTFATAEQLMNIDILNKFSRLGSQVGMFITGRTGFGKTHMAKLIGEINKMPVAKFNCGSVESIADIFGTKELRKGETIFIPNEETLTLMEGNCVVVWDELNRANPKIGNALLSLLDASKSVNILGFVVKMGKNIINIATANFGWSYTGTYQIDLALIRRFPIRMTMNALPPEAEKKLVYDRMMKVVGSSDRSKEEIAKFVPTANRISTQIVKLASDLRALVESNDIEIPVSTDEVGRFAEIVGLGYSPRIASEMIFVNACPNDSQRKSVTDKVNALFGSYDASNPYLSIK